MKYADEHDTKVIQEMSRRLQRPCVGAHSIKNRLIQLKVPGRSAPCVDTVSAAAYICNRVYVLEDC